MDTTTSSQLMLHQQITDLAQLVRLGRTGALFGNDENSVTPRSSNVSSEFDSARSPQCLRLLRKARFAPPRREFSTLPRQAFRRRSMILVLTIFFSFESAEQFLLLTAVGNEGGKTR